MTLDLTTLDAHEQPSDELRRLWKNYQRTDHTEFANHPDIDEVVPSEEGGQFQLAGKIPSEKLRSAFQQFEGVDGGVAAKDATGELKDAPIYFHPLLPGLLILPSLIPLSTQKVLLSRMIHRDLSNPAHQTNLHLHFNVPYREDGGESESATTNGGADAEAKSFFNYPPSTPPNFTPKDPSVHRPLSIKQVLGRRLSWVTLGGQYDWSNRQYPSEGEEAGTPRFPPDIAGLLQTLFPDTLAQAAIVNFYSPGDTMMMHRDVSEHTDKGLVSLSIGCDALFMIAPNDFAAAAAETEEVVGEEEGEQKKKKKNKGYLLLRLRSGDAIYMSQESRYAWHGVPKVLKNTCPDFLADWPAGEDEDEDEDGRFEEWRGWMRNKRINLNVRQMK
ncbi:hypothetical protein F4809DRAFT_601221 [Biscogniauxia mediterranea]|nr:hypothetical protein F4809DRAFT_601221 [Biscogniauxia mediterranea]